MNSNICINNSLKRKNNYDPKGRKEEPKPIVVKKKNSEDLKKKLSNLTIKDVESINTAGIFDMHKRKIIFGLVAFLFLSVGGTLFFFLSRSRKKNTLSKNKKGRSKFLEGVV